MMFFSALFVFGFIKAVQVARASDQTVSHLLAAWGFIYFFLFLQRDLNVMTIHFLFCPKSTIALKEHKKPVGLGEDVMWRQMIGWVNQ